jgi:hypothetical protein
MRESKAISSRSRRVHDFPELQVGFPERNDVSNPNIEMERIDVDVNTSGSGTGQKLLKLSHGKSAGRKPVS